VGSCSAMRSGANSELPCGSFLSEFSKDHS
jgi:hypothetical protein